ncbi:MAG: DUF4380 domain-containing protein [Xanthomonas sp.]|nr:DUF4380 domain-containing protein [Xanthomonas sp.]
MRTFATPLFLLALCLPASLHGAEVERIRLQSTDVVLDVTPTLGGRVLHVGRVDRPNLIRIGEPVASQPMPAVSADADDIGYLGHDVWLGPQSGWWSDQQVNPSRRATRAVWPPDPFLAFAETRVVARAPDRLVLEGVDSPVTGVRLLKSFAFDPSDPSTVVVTATARNIRRRPVARDLWFNTRTSAATRVYVPVADAGDVRVDGAKDVLPAWRIDGGVFSFLPAPAEAAMRRGKVFLQPSAGWMAGFAQGQAFVIRFDHQPRAAIHPEHGQIELYLDHTRDVQAGLLEMEVHAPFRTLAAGEAMQSRERWTVLAYDGPETQDAQLAFLCERLELCVAGQ